jgi:hypothetical protein
MSVTAISSVTKFASERSTAFQRFSAREICFHHLQTAARTERSKNKEKMAGEQAEITGRKENHG